MRLLRGLFLGALLLFTNAGLAAAEQEIKEGETEIHGYLDFLFFDDRGIGWSGSETTFTIRAKVDIQHALYDDVLVRFKGEYQPSVHPYSRAYGTLKDREGNIEDTYIQLTDMLADDTVVRLGAVKVPFGHFNTFSLENRNRPVSSQRYRDWDFGVRLDTSYMFFDVAFAVVNGEGRTGTDANSSKSVSLRLSFPASPAGSTRYEKNLEITDYPNPMVDNPNGDFRWEVGTSAYIGNRYTTPIKEKNNHYALDLKVDYSIFSFKAQGTYFEGFFTYPQMTAAEFTTFVTDFLLGSAPTYDIENFRSGYSVWGELAVAISEKLMMGAMYEYYDPDVGDASGLLREVKRRIVFGIKRDIKPNVTTSLFYTWNFDPSFGTTGDILETDKAKGDNVLMINFAVAF